MLRLSKKSVLALEAVLDIAFYARVSPVQSREITARQGIPDPDDDDTVSNSELAAKVVGPLWSEIEGNILRWFDDISIADLCDMADRRGVTTQTVIHEMAG